MRPEMLERTRELERTHWWFQGRHRLLTELQARLGMENALILDAGCGTGFARRDLSEAGMVVGLDACVDALLCRREPHGMDCVARMEAAPFGNDTFDLVLALDLIEHIPDDRKALREMHRICKPGGHLFITVPAYRWLWSAHDRALGHQRRYASKELELAIREAGFEIVRLSHLVTSVFLPAACVRLVRRGSHRLDGESDLSPVPLPLNAVLSWLMRIESRLMWRMRLPFGLSIVALARKPDGSQEAAELET